MKRLVERKPQLIAAVMLLITGMLLLLNYFSYVIQGGLIQIIDPKHLSSRINSKILPDEKVGNVSTVTKDSARRHPPKKMTGETIESMPFARETMVISHPYCRLSDLPRTVSDLLPGTSASKCSAGESSTLGFYKFSRVRHG